jgi:hypothetical protein
VGYDEFDDEGFDGELPVKTWSVVEGVSRLLPVDDRTAVLGDLIEANESSGQMLAQVSGMVARRQLALWRSWQPWLAGFGLAWPASLFLMGMSVSVSSMLERTHWEIVGSHAERSSLASIVFLLVACSWAAGFVVSFLSRRTLWVSGVCCVMPCISCFLQFRMPSLSRFSLFLFLVPALIGIWRGLSGVRTGVTFVTGLAIVATMLMIRRWDWNLWLCSVALLWPIWFVAYVAWAKAIVEKRVTA